MVLILCPLTLLALRRRYDVIERDQPVYLSRDTDLNGAGYKRVFKLFVF